MVGIVAAVILASSAWSAEETNKQSGSPDIVIPVAERAPLFDISFPGGTLEDFVAAVEKAITASSRNPIKPNLLVPAEARTVRMPKIELRSVDMKTLTLATSMLLQPEGHVWSAAGDKAGNTWVLVTRSDLRKTQAYYIGHLLKKFKVADITTALDTVWQMGSAAKPELKYHEDTQMLIIRADRAQIEMAENVLKQLSNALVERDQPVAKEPAEALKNPPKPAKAQ